MQNIQSYKGRTVQQGQFVEVYRNLHNGLISIRDVKTKHVLGHTVFVELQDVTFKVSRKGRERVLRERRKNVHAYIQGRYTAQTEPITGKKQATYNPYNYNCFVDIKSVEDLTAAKRVQVFSDGTIYYE